MRTRPAASDPEIGKLFRCTRCHEWWPADREFFYILGDGRFDSYCRACRHEMKRRNLVGAVA